MFLFEQQTIPFGEWVNQLIRFLNLHLHTLLREVQYPVSQLLSYITDMLEGMPMWLFLSLTALISWQLGGVKKAVIWTLLLLGIGLIGMWQPAMSTLALVLTAVLCCLLIGIPLGIWMAHKPRNERILRPILDIMQTMPAFVYLVPVVILLGVGQVPGVIVTMVFALPPIIRLTNLGLRQVSPELVEAARSFGASQGQLLRRVKLPLAATTIFTGINQSIMLSLSMVVIASMISVEGLGKTVYHGIGRLDIGLAATGGLGIVLLAIVLDRITQAFGNPFYATLGLKRDQYGPLKYIKWKRMKYLLVFFFLGWLLLTAQNRGAFVFAESAKDEVWVKPATSLLAEELFTHKIVLEGVRRLGYQTAKTLELEYPMMHVAVSESDADFATAHWNPNHANFYKNAGGDRVLERLGALVDNCVQGYMIDKATADKYNITSFNQLKDPAIAKIFDTDNDGKANLSGCQPGWGCEGLIDYQLDAYGLGETVHHDKGAYVALIAEVISRSQVKEPILYYTWKPMWLFHVLVEDRDVVWLEVDTLAIPYEKDSYQVMYKGKNLGFEVASLQVIGRRTFIEKHPRLRHFLMQATVPIDDVSAQSFKMREGEKTVEDISRHADEWIAANRALFDSWIEEAMEHPLVL